MEHGRARRPPKGTVPSLCVERRGREPSRREAGRSGDPGTPSPKRPRSRGAQGEEGGAASPPARASDPWGESGRWAQAAQSPERRESWVGQGLPGPRAGAHCSRGRGSPPGPGERAPHGPAPARGVLDSLSGVAVGGPRWGSRPAPGSLSTSTSTSTPTTIPTPYPLRAQPPRPGNSPAWAGAAPEAAAPARAWLPWLCPCPLRRRAESLTGCRVGGEPQGPGGRRQSGEHGAQAGLYIPGRLQ